MKIAVLLDATSTSRDGLSWALSLKPDQVVLLHTVDALIPDLAVGRALEASHELSQLARSVRQQGFDCRTQLLSGPKIPSLVEGLEGFDLAVVCAPERPGWTRWLRRSVSRGLAERAPCPVLVVRPGEARVVRRVLVPLDGSVFAEGALQVALACMQARPAQLLLLGASGEIATGEDAPDHAFRQGDLARLGEYLASWARRLSGPDFRCDWRLEDAPAVEAILEWAERERADMIVLATHGRRGLSRWLLGSVGQGLLDRSKIPLLLVNPRARGTKGADWDELSFQKA